MGVNKNFVVKNGFEVATDLILANADTHRVGIGTTPRNDFDVVGQTRLENLNVTGISTFSRLIGNNISIAGSMTALNYYGDGSNLTGIETSITPPGKTYFVTYNGNDLNDGTKSSTAFKTIKRALAACVYGDTVKVYPGTYLEDNPLTVPSGVAIEGAELRNCIVIPINPDQDLFWVSNAVHITDLSFQGQPATNNSAVVAFKPLLGTNSGRYFDAARMIRYNLDFIAGEAVGYITSTDYRTPAFSLNSGDYTSCKDDIKDVMKAVCHDITRGGNSKCVGAGKSYYDGVVLQHIVGVKTESIDAIHYAAGIAVSCINNVSWNGSYQNEFTQVRDLSMQNDPATESNVDINSCANVVSAIYSCVGIVTTIIKDGPIGISTVYPGGVTDPELIPSQGVGPITQGPYIRNCTNFIQDSVGMRVDGFHAEPGDKDDIGVTGAMSVDSYTQYNQGGIGVDIKNGAYAQLVSIFTICDNIAVLTDGGGQCDITNSNSSFGTYGLVSDGVGGQTSKSIYRYTGEVAENTNELDDTIVISGIGNLKPYTGQVVYFDELYYDVESVTIVNGGSGYDSNNPPTVIFTEPTGPNAIRAEGIATVENGKVVGVTLIGSGRNYKLNEAGISFTGSGGASAIVNSRPLYYQVRSATRPSAGITTVTLAAGLNNNVGIGSIAYFSRQSLQIVSSHSFEFIGAGNTIGIARPSLGGETVTANEIVRLNGGQIVFTSTDQDGNFVIGEDFIIDQATGTIRGRAFEKSLLNTITPIIIALGK